MINKVEEICMFSTFAKRTRMKTLDNIIIIPKYFLPDPANYDFIYRERDLCVIN